MIFGERKEGEFEIGDDKFFGKREVYKSEGEPLVKYPRPDNATLDAPATELHWAPHSNTNQDFVLRTKYPLHTNTNQVLARKEQWQQ